MATKLMARSVLAINLIMARQAMRMTQDEVADVCQIPRSTYAFYETGDKQPTKPEIFTLGKVLDVPVSSLILKRFPHTRMRNWDIDYKRSHIERKSLKLWLRSLGWELHDD